MSHVSSFVSNFSSIVKTLDRKNIYVLHHDDLDGYMSAGVVDHFVSTQHTSCNFIAVQYGQDFPKNVPLYPTTYILIVDFSYKREILENIANQVGGLIVIDHHKTAQKDLEGLSYAVYDMNECGASLTWKFLAFRYQYEKGLCYTSSGDIGISQEMIHPALTYTRDWDLWKFEHPETKHFEAACRAHSRYKEVSFYNDILKENTHDSEGMIEAFDFDQFMAKGKTIFEYEEQQLVSFVKRKKYEVVDFNRFVHSCVTCSFLRAAEKDFNGCDLEPDLNQFMKIYPFFMDEFSFKASIPHAHNLAIYNCVDRISATATAVYTSDYVVDFVMSFFSNFKKLETVFSLRSPKKSDIDVSLLAVCFGGGGHVNASGFALNNDQAALFLEQLRDSDLVSLLVKTEYILTMLKIGIIFTYVWSFIPQGLTSIENKKHLVSIAAGFYEFNSPVEGYNSFFTGPSLEVMREELWKFLEKIGFFLPTFPESLLKSD